MLWPCPDCILPFCFYLFVNCPCGAMTCEVKLNTLQGSVITLDILMTATVRELKSMLLEKHPCQDPTERKVLKVELLRDSSIIDDAESLDEAGLVGAQSLVTVTYTRNEVEAATKNDIRTQGYFGVKIPCNLPKISQSAFQNSPQLVLLTIPESVTDIGSNAFRGCTSLASITFGGSVTFIGSSAFHGCTSLTSITLGDSVTHIRDCTFCECTSLASITLGGSVTFIGMSAFHGCTSLRSITLGDSMTHIRDLTFCECTSLASITLGGSVTFIGMSAFHGCTSLTSITLGDSVTRIRDAAFGRCTSLASITLGVSVTHIASNAFHGCTSLASITLGGSVTFIGISAFHGCTSLRSITLGDSVTHIRDLTFCGCTSLASITLGESLTSIGDYAFQRCTSLASITLSESVTHIGKNAFHGCTSLARITIPESFKLRDILTRELWNISPTVVTIPARQGTKRLRKEWVPEKSSVQTCSDANCPQIVTTCRKTSVWLWPRDELDALLDFLMHTAKLNLVVAALHQTLGWRVKMFSCSWGISILKQSQALNGTNMCSQGDFPHSPPYERRKTRSSPCIRFI